MPTARLRFDERLNRIVCMLKGAKYSLPGNSEALTQCVFAGCIYSEWQSIDKEPYMVFATFYLTVGHRCAYGKVIFQRQT